MALCVQDSSLGWAGHNTATDGASQQPRTGLNSVAMLHPNKHAAHSLSGTSGKQAVVQDRR
jgi:hypothetical protein